MGGIYGDKPSTLARFKENYIKLRDKVKKRLVLENDEVRIHDHLEWFLMMCRYAIMLMTYSLSVTSWTSRCECNPSPYDQSLTGNIASSTT